MKRQPLIAAACSFVIAACAPDAQDAGDSQAGSETLGAQDEIAPGPADQGPGEHLLYQPGDIEWRDGPPSLEPGAQFAVLEGDPGAPGIFTLRIRMPDGFKIAPHWHPKVERVTVVSGVFRLGMGDQLDPQAAQAIEPGGYTAIPVGMRHYALADGETLIQLTSEGPWELNYVNQDDDPRSRN